MGETNRLGAQVARRCGNAVARAALLAVLAIVATSSPGRASVVVEIGDAAGPPAATAALAVRLRTDGDPITGLRHDLVLPDGVRVAPRPGRPERPDCRLSPDLLPGEAGAAFFWVIDPSCPGVVCRRPGAEVITSRAYFRDGVVLYSCTLDISPEAAEGRYDIGCSFLDTSDDYGNPIAADWTPGELVIDAQLPRPTPPPTVLWSTPTPMPTACPACGPLLEIGTASGVAGERVEFPVTLHTGGRTISGLQVDIGFPAVAPVPPRIDRSPDCTLGDGLGGWSTVTFQPYADIIAGKPATAVRALLLMLENDPIADGATVLTCSVDIASDAEPGRYPLSATNLLGSDPRGVAIELPGAAGAVEVVRRQGEQPVVDDRGAAAAGGNGCAIGGTAPPSGWVLLLPLLAALRRRAGRR